jgi:predicted transposase YdaD
MIRLPAEAEAAFRKDLYDFETSKQMPYITTVERAGIKKGLRRGLQRGRRQGVQQGVQQGAAAVLLWLIEKRFGADVAQRCRGRVETAGSDDLPIWSERILTADSIAQVLD